MKIKQVLISLAIVISSITVVSFVFSSQKIYQNKKKYEMIDKLKGLWEIEQEQIEISKKKQEEYKSMVDTICEELLEENQADELVSRYRERCDSVIKEKIENEPGPSVVGGEVVRDSNESKKKL